MDVNLKSTTIRNKYFKPLVIIQTYEDRNSSREFNQKVSERLSNLSIKEASQAKPTTLNRQNNSGSNNNGPPPPPPPLPKEETQKPHQNQNQSQNIAPTPHPHHQKATKPKAPPPPPPIKTSTLSFHQPPPCPTPDYDNLSISSASNIQSSSSSSSTLRKKAAINGIKSSHNIDDKVEMESLDSFKLNQPTDHNPKPPSIYFSNKRPLRNQISNGSINSNNSSTLTKQKQRPISVTIGEYPSGMNRKQPSKFDFLQNGNDGTDQGKQPITSQLASELAQTLHRSNLRKKTESMTHGN